ncbi:type IV toxin-antitoxin system AbiEi family antitoxin domain-containing protein [Arthrobacter monumenti]
MDVPAEPKTESREASTHSSEATVTSRKAATVSHLGVELPRHRLLSTSELSAMGFSTRWISDAVTYGELVRIRRGVYLQGEDWRSLDQNQRALCKIHAFHLGTQGTTIFSHLSAARLHGCFTWKVPGTIHVTQKYSTKSKAYADDVVVHTRPVTRRDLSYVDGRWVTSLERTVVDCARVLEFRKAVIIADHALRLGADGRLMQQIALESAGSRGIRSVRRVLANANGSSESPGETLTRLLIDLIDFPQAELQYEISTRLGLFRADFAWPASKLILEFDGRDKYFSYQPTEEALFEERRREKVLMEAGWSFVRLEWGDLFSPNDLQRRLAQAMNGRVASNGLTTRLAS